MTEWPAEAENLQARVEVVLASKKTVYIYTASENEVSPIAVPKVNQSSQLSLG